MDTGLGRDSLSIISQNSINAFVQSKPEERRGMFEEAAGVARYKQRKKESVAKLERTTTNLERVEDIVNELERQLNPLKRQKEKAETYLSLKDQLQEIEVSVLVKEIQKFTEELKTVDQELKKLDSDKVQNEAQMTLNEGKKEELEAKMYQLDQEVNDLQGKLLAAMNRVNDLEMQKVEIDANRKHILESTNKEDLEAKIANMKAIKAKGKDMSAKEEDVVSDGLLVQEMYSRGFEFMPIDIYRAKARRFQIIDGKLMPSFVSIDGLGDTAAIALEEAVKQGPFISKDDLKRRAGLSQTSIEKMSELGLLSGLPESNQISLTDLFKV